jgi:putative ABC transport system permease protein
MTEALPLSAGQVAMAAALVGLNGGLSLWLGLGLEKRLLVAAVRALVQLTVLGLLLVPVFQLAHPGLVALLVLGMVVLAAREALSRTSRRVPGILGTTLFSLLLGCGGTAVFGAWSVIGAEPWWTPQYAIPLVGMLLGNSLTGVSLGLDRCLESFDARRAVVEARLAFGATRWEAARPVVADALRVAMVPILHTMSAVGLVTIPGMMTGQILAGSDPILASRYQLVILFLIAASVALGSTVAVLVTTLRLFDGHHRLRTDRITRREP